VSASSAFTSLLWFIAILAMIPVALWLWKRTPAGGAQVHGLMRTVAVLPLAPGQRIVTVEVGRDEQRKWLVLGVTGTQISALHEMAPQDEASPAAMPIGMPFAQWLDRFKGKDSSDAR
jgi:flagellar protein FliO/FliZ